MNRTFKTDAVALVLVATFAGSVAAGPFEDGLNAVAREDHATAIRLWGTLADQGNVRAQVALASHRVGRVLCLRVTDTEIKIGNKCHTVDTVGQLLPMARSVRPRLPILTRTTPRAASTFIGGGLT
jgi:hypothetical protein